MQGKKLFIGNLDYAVSKDELQELLAQYGSVTDVKIIGDKGFAFIEMSTQAEAENAKKNLNGFNLKGRSLRVDAARPRKEGRRDSSRRY
ncbi:MAG: RNA-binding protein [Spirochaetes bacterium]|jgi:RNA recognition motif-containing protein|nr:RNA-binding protein [Spirochaetota bacterium]